MNSNPLLHNIDNYRPIPFYFITTTNPEDLSYETAIQQMTDLKESGFGGCIFFNKPPYGFDIDNYLTDTWFETVRNYAQACKQVGLKMWINDGFDFPPGDAGGRIKAVAPHLKQHRLTRNAEGKPTVVEVPWGFPAFEEPESSQLFIKFVYEAHKEHLGEYFGNTITGFFSDADARRVNFDIYFPDSPQRDYFPWSANFSEIFNKKYGYDIEPYLNDILDHKSCRAIVDYWSLTGQLYAQWFANNHKWCKENGLKYTFHSSDTGPFPLSDSLRSSIFAEGRIFDILKHSDFPGTDHEILGLMSLTTAWGDFFTSTASWGGDDSNIKTPTFYTVYKDVRAKQASSVAFLNNSGCAMCEMFAATNWGVSPEELRQIAAWQIMQGIGFIVPHAVHLRLHGETKYFAPPDFSSVTSLGWSMKEFNDTLAKWACLGSSGSLVAPLALLDITERVWSNDCDSTFFFRLCEELNRHPQGYVIADAELIAQNADKFKAVINPGLVLTSNEEAIFEKAGLQVISAQDIAKLDDIVPCDVKYTGEGRPHFMRRTLPNGEMLVAIANIEDSELITGKLTVGDNTYNLELYPGEIAFFSPTYLDYRTPVIQPAEKVDLPLMQDVEWGSANIIPIVRWETPAGRPCTLSDSGKQFIFKWKTEPGAADLKLRVPVTCKSQIRNIYIDGVQLTSPVNSKIFNDSYLDYLMPEGELPGEHTLIIEKHEICDRWDQRLPWTEKIILSGEFDVDLKTENDYYLRSATQYNLAHYIPEKADITIKSRVKQLRTDTSWTEQGHPFYSGLATYTSTVDIPSSWEKASLVFPQVACVREVIINDKAAPKCLWKPYTVDLGNKRGTCNIKVTVNNTLGNMLEFYKAPSGLLFKGYCRKE